MPYPYRSFRDWLSEEDARGNVVRIKKAIKAGDYENLIDIGNDISGKQPETDIRALVRYLHSLPGKPIGIVERPINNRPDIPLIVNPWPTRERVLNGMGVSKKDELCQKLIEINNHRIEAQIVSKHEAPCKQVIINERELDLRTNIPKVWVEFNQWCWAGCNGTIINFDQATRNHDLGKLRAGPFDWRNANPEDPYDEETVRTCMIATMSPPRTGHTQSNSGRIYWSNRRQGITTRAAYVYGIPTDIHVVAAIRGLDWPQSGDEYELVGGLRGEAVEVVESETIPGLMVPASAEWVIEVEFLLEDEITPQYGEDVYFGHMVGNIPWPKMRVKCITHRKEPIWDAATFSSSGLNGHDGPHSALKMVEREADYINFLRVAGFRVKDVVMNAYDGQVVIIQTEVDGADKPSAHYGKMVGMALLSNLATDIPPKYVITVGPDINPYDYKDIMWALSTRTIPISDMVTIEKGRGAPDMGSILSPSMNYGEQIIIDGLMKIPERCTSFPPRSEPVDWEVRSIERIRKLIDS